jgi:pilus assembly protein CpaB
MLLRALLIIVSGLGLAAGGVFVAVQMSDGERVAAAAPVVETTPVVIADAEIAFAKEITRELVRVQEWPSEFVPEGAFDALDEVIGDDERGFRRAERPLAEGEPLLASKLSAFGEKVTIAQVIDPDKRAISIRVDDVSGVGGFVTPGDRVDVVLTRHRNDDQIATTILQDVLVRGIDQIADEERDKPVVARTVTVEAQRLVLAQQAGRLSLTLRPAGMHDQVATSTITSNSLTNIAANAQVGPRGGRSVTVRRGTAEEVVPVVR